MPFFFWRKWLICRELREARKLFCLTSLGGGGGNDEILRFFAFAQNDLRGRGECTFPLIA